MDDELVMVPGAPMPQAIPQGNDSSIADAPDAPQDTPAKPKAKKWSKRWVIQETLLGSKYQFLKWVNEDTSKWMDRKLEDQENDSEYEALYVCTFDKCGKTFSEASALKKHAHSHGEKQYICTFGCGKRFVDSSKLKRHHLIHTGEKHFTCNHCGKAFSLDFNLRSHMRTHTGENYHVCPYEECGKKYAHEYKLRAHMKSHHNMVYPDGRQVPLESDSTKASPATTSGGKQFACPHEGCDKRYLYPYKLNLHLKREHANDEMVQNGASDEYSEGSEENRLGKSKLRIPKAPPAKSKKKKASAGGASKALPPPPPPPPPPTVADNQGKVCRSSKQDDSEETEDEGGRDEMLYEDAHEMDEEETEDDMD